MKATYKVLAALITTGIVMGTAGVAKAGNGDRAGQAGATELLINPWALAQVGQERTQHLHTVWNLCT